jgi:WS/DGAT/MGAT family acyltransferase
MERMSGLDASFLYFETPTMHMHVVAAIVHDPSTVEGGYSFQKVKEHVASRLHLAPALRRRLAPVPLNLHHPVWVEDPDFDLDYHVRRIGCPSPGGEEELAQVVGDIAGRPLDRTKPLWEMWMVEGLQDGHWALVSKVHHCMVDGVSGSDLLAVMLDPQREPPPPNVDTWRPEPEPSDVRLVSEAVGDLVASPYEQFRAMRSAARGWRQLGELFADAARGAASMAGLVRPTVESSLNGPIGPHRRWDWAHTTLADVKRVRSALGGTVNDVVLAVLTRGFRDLIVARDESPVGRVVRTLVPVSVRLADERGVYNNRVSAMFAQLPVGISDPAERLDAIRTQMAGLKESKQAVAGEVLTSLSGFAPALLLALGTRVAFRIPQRNVNTVTTNVPGPQFPLYACGRQMLEAFPFVPIAGHLRIGVAIFSYNGMLNFGVTGDYDTAPDIGVLCRGVEDGMSELLKLAGATGPDDMAQSAGVPTANESARD